MTGGWAAMMVHTTTCEEREQLLTLSLLQLCRNTMCSSLHPTSAGLILFRRTHPDHEISKALSEQERQEDEAEQREINAAMERERQKIKERAEKTRTPSMSPSMGRESVRDIIDKVRRGAPDVGKRASPVNALDASSEVDQLEGTQSSPGLYPPLPRSVSKRGAASSPTPSESELATSPMLMASGGLKNPLMDNIKEVDLPPSVDTSEQEGPSSDRSSDTSDDSADEDELEESDDEPEESKSGGEKDLRDTSESIATSSDPEEKGGQDGEVEEEVDEEEEEDQIEATPAPAKTNTKSGWMPSLGSIFGLKSSQDTPIAEKEIVAATQDSGPPSAQRSRAGAVGTKADPVTPSFSARPRLTGGTRLSELDTSKVRSSFSQPNTPIGGGLVASSQPTMGKSSVPAKRRAEISFDSDSDEDDQPSEDSDSDNDIRKRPPASLPIAKRAGQKQSKRPRSSLLAKMTPS